MIVVVKSEYRMCVCCHLPMSSLSILSILPTGNTSTIITIMYHKYFQKQNEVNYILTASSIALSVLKYDRPK